MSVEWSTSSEWVLYTGGCDGAIRFWDIRRAGCFRVLDQSVTQLGVRPPILKHTAVSSKVCSNRMTFFKFVLVTVYLVSSACLRNFM